MNKQTIIDDASRGVNYMLAAILACGKATKAEIAEARRLTDPKRDRPVNAHDHLVAALKLVDAKRRKTKADMAHQVIVKATTTKPVTKLDEVRLIARQMRADDQIPRGDCQRVINVADRVLAEHPDWTAEAAVIEARGIYRGLSMLK